MSSELLHPLSSPQQAVWLDQSLAPDLPCYNIGVATRLEGPTDPDRLEAAIRAVAGRHQALRTVLERGASGVMQRFAETVDAPLQRFDFSSQADPEASAWAHMRAAFLAPFALYGQRLWRMQWLQVAPGRGYWLGCFHHLVADGWSVSLIGNAVADAYNRLGRGEPAVGGDVHEDADYADYADFIRKDAEYLASPRYAADRAFWLHRHSRLAAPLFEAAQRGRIGRKVAQAVWLLDRADHDRLGEVAAAEGASSTHFLAALLAVYFARWSGREDDEVVIGMPVHNRTGAAQRRMPGMFSGAIPVGIAVDPEETFAQTLRRVAGELKQCYRHQRYPLADLHRELLAGVGERRGLFDLSLSVESFQGDLGFEGIRTSVLPLHNGHERQPLAVYVRDYEHGRPVHIEFNHDPALFSAEEMAAHLRRLQGLCRAAFDAPDTRVRDLPLMDAAERELVVHGFNRPRLDTGAPSLIHALFERQARQQPDAVAVQFDGQRLSYGELNRRANQLAHHLRALGVGPDDLVAIGLARGLGMVVAILATLKAGGAYVPLDPVYPDERLAHTLRDSAPVVLLGDIALLDRLQTPASCRRVNLDQQAPWADAPAGNPHVEGLAPSHLAYVIYTSGSTGLPKGVMVEHAQVSRLFDATRAWFDFGRGDVWTLFHSFAFDFSVWELWGALIHGGRLVVVPHAVSRAPAEFHRLVCEQGVTVLNQTPGAFRQFAAAACQAGSPELPRHALRHVVLGGEALDMAALGPWYAEERNAATRLVNMYGITETTVHVTCRVLEPADAGRTGASPIGVRIPDLSVYVLDPEGRPLPVGCTGEMYVGGAGVARGYLRRPELDAQRFVPDPFGGVPGARMYRTGDLGRYLADGSLAYIGRNDQQVKVRGFRIELGEIEAQLMRRDGVADAVAIAREDMPGDTRLVAYLVAGAAFDPSAARAALREHLPDHMVPAAFVVLDALPLTPNGKLDRRALPAPDPRAWQHRDHAPAQGATEAALARLWADVLGVERVGRHDNFFELGGHSILAVQLVERMQREGLELEIRHLFAEPTLSALAARVTQAGQAGQAGQGAAPVPANAIPARCERITPQMLPLVPLSQAQIDRIVDGVSGGARNVQDIYPLAPLQEGILFHHLLQGEGDAYVLPALLRFDDRQRLDRFMAALQQVIARHDILRTAVQWEGLDAPVQVVWRHAALMLQELHVDPAGGDVQAQLQARADARQVRLDLRRAPMLQAHAAFDPVSGRWLLQLLHHHLTLDHTTTELILHEVVALLQGRGEALPPPVPFREFVARSRQGVSAAEHEAFFGAMLGDVDEPTAPFGLLDVQGDGSQVEQARLTLPPALSARLRALAMRHGVGAASLFHLAWARVLALCSGRDDVVFGTVLFGRMQGGAGIDRAMGMFINTLPVRIALGGRGVAEGLRETHVALSGLLRHEHASLTLAQRCSSLAPNTPMFSALLNYRHSRSEGFGDTEIAAGMHYLGGRDLTNYPFSLYVDDLGGDFVLTAEIHASVSAGRVAGFMQQALQAFAQALEEAPDTPLLALDVLPAEERERVLHGFNDTSCEYTAPALVHEAFEQQAAAHPDRIALELDGAQLSYRDLNEQANRLARHLCRLGVGPDDRVAICAERSLAMGVAILATLKAGGACVPLDPTYPDERLAQMLRDSEPVVVLSQRGLAARLDATSVLLDDAEPAWANASMANLHANELGLRPEHLAYVIYTSGSTGVPKGVAMPHRGLVNLLAWQREQLPEPARTLQFAALGFDVAFQEIFSTLAGGGTLVLLHEALRQDLPALAEWLAEESIERMFLPYIALNNLSELWSQRSAPLLMLRDVITAGEQLRITPAIRRMFERHPQARLHNHYGPTETHVVSAHTLSGQPEQWEDLPSIGRPIGNSRIYVLDAQHQPVPVGVVGELYLGGVQVARGYLAQPDLTEARFLTNPFDGARMYRSGDLGRWRADGSIEYVGRNDHQVKIRGYRIELGEIEAQLVRVDGVREAAVLAREDQPGDKRLVAYLVGQADAAQLRAQLGQHLPDYMVPVAYVVLDALPLTPNGKLDRKALPAPEGDAFGQGAYAAPQGEIEQALAEIWSQLLGVERVGRNDDFFQLGGHSLLAIRLLDQLGRRGWSADIRSLFTHPKLAALAATIRHDDAVAVPPPLIPPGCTAIEPAMLTLVDLDAAAIARIVQATPGGAANIQDIYPLAPLQQGILFHHLLERDTDTYVLPTLLEFDSRPRMDRFIAALSQVIERHDILRTAVHWENLSEPVQVVWRRAGFAVDTLTLAPGTGTAAGRLRAHPQVRGLRIDVRRAPMLHGVAARDEASGRWLLLLSYHHLVMDHTTLERLVEEIDAIERGSAAGLPPPVPFRNFVAEARHGVSAAEHEAFFGAMLGDVDEPTAPFGLLDVQGDGSQIEQARVTLPQALSARLRALAMRHGVGAASLFHLAWARVLALCSGRDDVVFGTVLFGRMHGGTGSDRAVGMFINTLPMRIALAGRGAVQGLRETHAAWSGLLRHEHAPLVLAQRCSAMPAQVPLFSALLNYRHSRVAHAQVLDGVRLLEVRDRTNYPFGLYVDDDGSDFELTVQVDAAVSAGRVAGFVQQALQAFAQALEEAPDTPLLALDVLPAEERERVLHGFNDTSCEYTAPALVHEAFEQQAAAHPDRIALELDGAQLSYRDLNEQANRLARHLCRLGVGPDDRVAICVERSLAMVVAILATLKAGGACVPLDPTYPDERLAQMLRDSEPVVVLSQHRLIECLALGNAASVLLDEAEPAWANASTANLHANELGLRPEHLAYVIYTSGSTGVPKGVAMPHRGLVNLLAWQREQLPEPARTLQFAALGFDVAFQEIFSTLAGGGTLVLLHEALRQDLPALAEWLAEESIERMFLPYIALNNLSELWSQRSEPLAMLRDVITAGEQLRITPAIRRMFERHPQARLHNHYGPTETHVVSAHTLSGAPEGWEDLPPIGQPIGNSRIYVLDAQRTPVPVGVVGELYLGGVQVARGYLAQPDLTEARFLTNPFDGARMYRSGDLGRWCADGSIEYLGRNDHQVKIRGYRIELGEIEAQLARLDGVREAAVLAREDQPGDKRLVAYLTGNADAAQLRAQLSQHLPDYMVPVAYVVLDALPLTPNGKLDRKALPAPEGNAFGQRAYAAPQGEIEQALAEIWSQLLGVQQVGRNDDFFQLGGHSLLAIRLISRIREHFDAELALATLFAHPRLAALAPSVAAAGRSEMAAIAPADRSRPLPLSPAQQRLWFIAGVDAQASVAYHIPGALRLRGALDRVALRAALDQVVARHESLRTRFVAIDGQPWQHIDAPHGFDLREQDAIGSDAARIEALCREAAAEPFDLAAGPPIRGLLLRVADEDHVLLVVMHHIVSDGWSLSVLMREFAIAYSARRDGRAPSLPSLPIQYADHAAWLHEHLQGEPAQARLQAWVAQLQGAPALTELPCDRPRPALQDYRGASFAVDLDAGTTQALRALGQRHGATLYMVVLAAWAAVVARYSGQSQVVIGSSHAGRGRVEIEPLIGCFINTQALKITLDGTPTVADLLAQVRRTALQAQAREDVPFERLVEALNPPRSMAHHPVFQLMLAWHNTPAVALELAGLAVERVESLPAGAQFDLALDLQEEGDRIAGKLNYATALFDEATVRRHWRSLVAMLRGMAADERRPVDRIALLDADARDRLLHAFAEGKSALPAHAFAHAAFEHQAALRPQAIALEHDGERLSYLELDRRANRLAHHLRGLGVGAEGRVALCLPRGFDLIVAVLATLKAGAAYVPLDPSHPDRRLAWQLEDCAPAVLLTQTGLHSRLHPPSCCTTIALDEPAPWADAPTHAPDRKDLADDGSHLAYVIYTSGSTGTPKGVMVEHRQLSHQIAALQSLYGFGAEDRVLQFSGLSFDVAGEEIFGALSHGATLVLRTDEWLAEPRRWCELCAAHRLTVANLPTLFWQRLAHAPDAVFPPSLRQIVIGGDAVGAAALDAWWQRRGHRPALANAYGPTETTINATVARCRAGDSPLSIGHPVPNARVHLLDAHGEPVPVGVVGEIWIGGAGVARGYLHRPGLTAQRFVADPFAAPPAHAPTPCMYRSGDLGRWRGDGSIEFLGRDDQQVKIRGFRIEPGEVEAALMRLDGIREAVVIAAQGPDGDKRLLAYVVTDPDRSPPDVAQWRARLAEHLPGHMLPAAFVRLDALPLNANGKLDRAALPAPDDGARAQRSYQAPRGAHEQALAQIWSSLLGIARIGRDDGFFELGGHSLLAVRMLSQLRQRFGVELALTTVFAQPRLAELAAEMARAIPILMPCAIDPIDPIVPADRSAPLLLSHAQQRLWYVTRIDAQAGAAYHLPAALRLRGTLDRIALQNALDRIAARHESLRGRFVVIDGEPRQRIEPAHGVALGYRELDGPGDSALRALSLRALCQAEAAAPFDLARDPPLRVQLLRLAEDDHVLLVTMHHIVSDGWSLSVLAHEFSALYGAFRRGEPDPLPALPVQYGDYAAWQRRRLQGEALQPQLRYWVERLRDAPPLIGLATDRPRPPQQDYRGASIDVGLDGTLTRELGALAQRHGVTVYMTVLAAWAAVLARLSGQSRVVLGSSIAGRDRAELEPLIGFFVNAQALRLDIDDGIDVGSLLAQARQVALQAQQHRDVPFEQVVEALNPTRSSAFNPVYQVRLAWQNTPPARLQLDGLEFDNLASHAGSAQFDLSLDLEPAGERITGQFNYATALYDEATVRRHWHALVAMLRGMVADAAAPVDRIGLMAGDERAQVLHAFNAGGNTDGDGLLHRLFEAQAAAQPRTLALAYEDDALDYGELNRRANRIAHHLRRLGLRPDDRVALCLERSVDLGVALMATLKAGGACVPLDPVHPDDRLAHMLADSAPVAVLTHARLRARLRVPDGCAVLVLDDDASPPRWADAPTHDPDPEAVGLVPAHLAYVIYTSGSTGVPKGVMVEHRHVLNFLRGMERRIHGPAPDCRRVAWNSSFGFDMAVKAWGQLAFGRSVYLLPERARLDAEALLDFLERHAIEAMECTPSHLRMLHAAGFGQRRAASLRKLLLGGEALDAATWQRLAEADIVQFHNMYGPTECSVDATCGPVAGAVPHIGRPMPGARIYLLDAHGEPVPIGVAGEIHIGGAGVARGYLGRPDLTAERFLPDPFKSEGDGDGGARMYRTGDLGRWRADGSIAYLGRNDFQVKVRGYRIELGEIEARLARLDGVREAVVVASAEPPGEPRLIAYLLAQPGAAVEPSALRAQLGAQLPDYMLPGAYIVLAAWPLNANGKLDRKALPLPGDDGLARQAYAAPATDIEIRLAAVWSELLGVERVGRHDNFFELGGHSALAIQLIHAMGAQQLQVDVQMVFNAQTLADLAAATVQLEEIVL
ncbi:non-ribosomal peptide synthase/polyketide synthase [Variovorax sp. ZS18.2.2]|uniref:non-ribosomal peptide synthase/polyketide synthase n=1 Tax=Variovorax sp. ZS18.2.2 TaxID=2971255 RepID=UPI0021517F9F|nr:non-ribosomal peptide synthase/polyketide synthase [Variovorax sp. ZS18.2.2]MCR6479407.1 non-ribosomal peptide synthase/polyketide synthase [Variovorax sp. ZS18.2.2]